MIINYNTTNMSSFLINQNARCTFEELSFLLASANASKMLKLIYRQKEQMANTNAFETPPTKAKA